MNEPWIGWGWRWQNFVPWHQLWWWRWSAVPWLREWRLGHEGPSCQTHRCNRLPTICNASYKSPPSFRFILEILTAMTQIQNSSRHLFLPALHRLHFRHPQLLWSGPTFSTVWATKCSNNCGPKQCQVPYQSPFVLPLSTLMRPLSVSESAPVVPRLTWILREFYSIYSSVIITKYRLSISQLLIQNL